MIAFWVGLISSTWDFLFNNYEKTRGIIWSIRKPIFIADGAMCNPCWTQSDPKLGSPLWNQSVPKLGSPVGPRAEPTDQNRWAQVGKHGWATLGARRGPNWGHTRFATMVYCWISIGQSKLLPKNERVRQTDKRTYQRDWKASSFIKSILMITIKEMTESGGVY